MSTNLFPHVYEELIIEDIEWLQKNTKSSLEQRHIISVLNDSAREYRDRGYMEAMTGTTSQIKIITCNCLTKTPEPKYHNASCPVFIEAAKQNKKPMKDC